MRLGEQRLIGGGTGRGTGRGGGGSSEEAIGGGNIARVAVCAIVVFEVPPGRSAGACKAALASACIAVSTTRSVHSFDPGRRDVPPAVRVSPHYFNSVEEMGVIVAAVREWVSSSAAEVE